MRVPLRTLLLAAAFAAGLSAYVPSAGAAEGRRVVVELFTSQGCSSCPPADAYLAELAERDDVIALSFHVDYWNYIGWTDPFSLPAATARQRAYGRALGKAYVYTPQMVIDGRAEAVGSSRSAVSGLIRMAASARPAAAIDVGTVSDGAVELRLKEAPDVRAEIWVGFYDRDHETAVRAGENRGATIRNANVVRVFRRLGPWAGKPLARKLDLAALGGTGRDGCVVIVQEPRGGKILGAVAFPVPRG